MTDLQRTFDNYAHQLDTKAAQLKQGTQILKVGGALSTTLGAIGLAGTGLGAVPLAVGLGLYGFAVAREKATTGRLMPLPFSQNSGAAMAATAIQESTDAVDIPITDFDYLSQDDRADYTLFGIMAPVIIPILQGADDVQAERWLTQARRSLIKYHGDMINDPELMAPALYGSIASARGAFAANLPDDLQARVSPSILSAATEKRDFSADEQPDIARPNSLPAVGATTRLGAIDVASAPASGAEATATLTALKAYVQQPKNLVVVASGGGGKGISLANLCRWRYEANSTFRAIWLDPKNDPDETGYMDHRAIEAIRFNADELPAQAVVGKVREMMNRFRELCAQLPPKTPVWLILDEWYFVLSVLQQHDTELLDEVIDVLRATVSLMDAKHKHIVLVGQSPKLDDLLPQQFQIQN